MLENRGKEMGSEKGGKERLFSGTGSFRVNSQGWGTQVNGKWVTVVISAFPYVLALSVGQRPVRHPKAGGTRVVRESLPKQVSSTDHPWCTLVVHPLDDTRGWGEGGCSMTWGPPIPSASSQEKRPAGRRGVRVTETEHFHRCCCAWSQAWRESVMEDRFHLSRLLAVGEHRRVSWFVGWVPAKGNVLPLLPRASITRACLPLRAIAAYFSL